MSTGIQVKVWGDFALFTRPEFKAERTSYQVMTPSAARGVIESIHRKPAIRWIVDRIRVLNPIRFDTVRRNEVAGKAPYATARTASGGRGVMPYLVVDEGKQRQQRAALVLRDVAYVIDAHFEMTAAAGPGDNPGKHADIIRRRLEKGQCAYQPSLGTREFTAFFAAADRADLSAVPDSLRGEIDLGWMLHDIDFGDGMKPHFFHAVLRDGVLEVPPFQGWRTAS